MGQPFRLDLQYLWVRSFRTDLWLLSLHLPQPFLMVRQYLWLPMCRLDR